MIQKPERGMSAEFAEFARRLADDAMDYALRAKREGGMEGLVSIAAAEAIMRVAHMARDTAKAIEAQLAETVKHGSVADESAVGPADLPK